MNARFRWQSLATLRVEVANNSSGTTWSCIHGPAAPGAAFHDAKLFWPIEDLDICCIRRIFGGDTHSALFIELEDGTLIPFGLLGALL